MGRSHWFKFKQLRTDPGIEIIDEGKTNNTDYQVSGVLFSS